MIGEGHGPVAHPFDPPLFVVVLCIGTDRKLKHPPVVSTKPGLSHCTTTRILQQCYMWQVDWKPRRVTDLVAHLRSVVHQQYEELRRSLAGLGDLQFTPAFAAKHLTTQMRWNGMSAAAKDKAFAKFMADTGMFSTHTSRITINGCCLFV